MFSKLFRVYELIYTYRKNVDFRVVVTFKQKKSVFGLFSYIYIFVSVWSNSYVKRAFKVHFKMQLYGLHEIFLLYVNRCAETWC